MIPIGFVPTEPGFYVNCKQDDVRYILTIAWWNENSSPYYPPQSRTSYTPVAWDKEGSAVIGPYFNGWDARHALSHTAIVIALSLPGACVIEPEGPNKAVPLMEWAKVNPADEGVVDRMCRGEAHLYAPEAWQDVPWHEQNFIKEEVAFEIEKPFSLRPLTKMEAAYLDIWRFGGPCDLRHLGEMAVVKPLVDSGYLFLRAYRTWPTRRPPRPAPPGPPELRGVAGPTPAAYQHLGWSWRYVGETTVDEAVARAVAQFPDPLVYKDVDVSHDVKSVSRFVPAQSLLTAEQLLHCDYFVRNRLVLQETRTRFRLCDDGYIINEKHTREHWGCTLPENHTPQAGEAALTV